MLMHLLLPDPTGTPFCPSLRWLVTASPFVQTTMLLPRVSANRLPSPANRNRRTFAQLVDRWLPTRARFFCVSRPAVGRPENRMCQLPDLPDMSYDV